MSTASSAAAPAPRTRRVLLLGGTLALGAAAGVAYRRRQADRNPAPPSAGDEREQGGLGWGLLARPETVTVTTPDGADLAVWEVTDNGPDAPVVVLPHCWGCSHEVWLPVARRLVEHGYRVVLYDQRGHGLSGRGTAPLDLATLADDLAAVLEATDVHDAVLAGHSMGGMTVMALATYRPEVLRTRARSAVLVATAATSPAQQNARAAQLGRLVISSPALSRAMRLPNGHVLVRNVFGSEPVRAHMDLTRQLFAGCEGGVRGDFLMSMTAMNLLEGIATMEIPTTVVVGSRDRLTLPAKADEMVGAIPGSRLVTLPNRGHMLPLEDPDAVTDEILRAAKG
jgi:pimeloyl-ACP methyl ester carboxylesterase